MRNTSKLLSFVATVSVLAAPIAYAQDTQVASTPAPALSQDAKSSALPAASSKEDEDPQFSTYKVTKEVSLQVQKISGAPANAPVSSIRLKPGMNLTVLDVSHDETLGDLVRLGLDASKKSGLPSDFWVRATDLIAAELQESDIVNNDRDPLNGSDDVMSAHSRLGGKKHGKKKKMTYCYHYVKEYLLQHKIVPVYLPGGSAVQAAGILPEYGLHRVARNNHDAKIGDICVYKGGNGNNGHIEIKRPQGWWYGYGFKSAPVNPADHRLVGCYNKGH